MENNKTAGEELQQENLQNVNQSDVENRVAPDIRLEKLFKIQNSFDK